MIFNWLDLVFKCYVSLLLSDVLVSIIIGGNFNGGVDRALRLGGDYAVAY